MEEFFNTTHPDPPNSSPENETLDDATTSPPSPVVDVPSPESAKSNPSPFVIESMPHENFKPPASPVFDPPPPSSVLSQMQHPFDSDDELETPPPNESPNERPDNSSSLNPPLPITTPSSSHLVPLPSSPLDKSPTPPLSASPKINKPSKKPPSNPSNSSNQSVTPPNLTPPSPIFLNPPLPNTNVAITTPPAPDTDVQIRNPPFSDAPDNSHNPIFSPENPLSIVNPLSTPVTPNKPSPSTPNERPSNVSPSLTPPKQSLSPSKESSNSKNSFGNGAVVLVSLVGFAVICCAIFFIFFIKRRKRAKRIPSQQKSVQSDIQSGPSIPSATGLFGSQAGNSSDSSMFGNSKSYFTYEEIADMTQGFSKQNLLGEGGFGCVYKGWLIDGRVVAVKQLKFGGGQGEREFRAEVEIISRVHHRHLVSLVGYCISEKHRSLVYEFVPNFTLEHHLHAKNCPVMDWSKRLRISIGSARGLAYLHEDCHPRIIHRDIKSANILLDDSFEAQVADFGLAKLANDTSTHVSTRVMGTFGYMAPEYASSGKLTDRSDVYSFGVVLLEIITGRKPVDTSQPLGEESLVEWARPLLNRALDTGNFEEIVDPRLENNYVSSQMFRMMEAAAACVRHSASKRPRMAQIRRALEDNGDLLDLSNGVKFGESTVFHSQKCAEDLQKFRRLAFGSDTYSSDCTEEGMSTIESGESSRVRGTSWKTQQSSGEFDGGSHWPN